MSRKKGGPHGSLEEKLNYRFKDPALLAEALTHASYANESGLPSYNERLEFLGDSVLGLCAASYLYTEKGNLSEGEMTKERARLVCEAALAVLGGELGVPPLMMLGKGLERQNGRENPSVIADATEAIIGAVFLDGGYDAAFGVVRRFIGFLESSVAPLKGDVEKSPKMLLQELLQSVGEKPPTYKLVSRAGPDHAQQFRVEVWSRGRGKLASGEGQSIKIAETDAASRALARLAAGAGDGGRD